MGVVAFGYRAGMLLATLNPDHVHQLLFVALILFIVGAAVAFVLAPRQILMTILFAGLAFVCGGLWFLV